MAERTQRSQPSVSPRDDSIEEVDNENQANDFQVHDFTTRDSTPHEVIRPNQDFVSSIADYVRRSNIFKWGYLVTGTAMAVGGIAGGVHALNHYTSPGGWATIWFSTSAAGLYITCKSLSSFCADDERPRGYYNVAHETALDIRPHFLAEYNAAPSESLPPYNTATPGPRSSPSFRSILESMPSFRSTTVSNPIPSGSSRDRASPEFSRDGSQRKKTSQGTSRRYRSRSVGCINELRYEETFFNLQFGELPPYSPEEWVERSRLLLEHSQQFPALEENEPSVPQFGVA